MKKAAGYFVYIYSSKSWFEWKSVARVKPEYRSLALDRSSFNATSDGGAGANDTTPLLFDIERLNFSLAQSQLETYAQSTKNSVKKMKIHN